ncbi:DUF7344 domain-containing protein [Salinigranum halophilum]|jgi:hypothetical protein|uniref:DUF7344 domain-containing protein n=1 Tax=Salinigranum halophilum TaxID=2565931 RepID=UPI00115C98EB|nr:hypothetical protein [Salinigranum halophilum]
MSTENGSTLTPSDGNSTGDETDDEEPKPISKDTQFGMLKNRRRRDILRYLRENDDESTLSDLAEFIAAKENGVERRLLSSDERKRVYIGLYQCHLPKMDDARVIDFEKRSGGVRLRPEADQLFAYIDDEDDEEESAGETTAEETTPWTVNTTVKLGLGWTLCLLAALSVAGIAGLPPVGVIGGAAAVTFAAIETVDVLPSLWADGVAVLHD